MSLALRATALYIQPPAAAATVFRYRMILHMMLVGLFWLASLLLLAAG